MDAIEWRCPKCGAIANEHGTGTCSEQADIGQCSGFLCECQFKDGGDDPGHGESYATPCRNAWCHHCGWEGEFPKAPAKWPKWTKTAIAEGWTPPKGWQP